MGRGRAVIEARRYDTGGEGGGVDMAPLQWWWWWSIIVILFVADQCEACVQKKIRASGKVE